MTLQWATRMGGVGSNASQPTADQTWVNPEAVREERINAEMDAEEAELEAYQRAMEASIESEQAADNIIEEEE